MSEPEFPSASVVSGSVGAGLAPGPTPAGYQPLYDLTAPSTMGFAAFLAGPLAGVWLIARNFRRLGRTAAATWMLALGIGGVAAVFALAFMLPAGFPPLAFSVPLVIAIWQIAHRTQGPAFEEHVARGGKVTSRGKVAAIAIAAVAIQIAVVVAGALVYVQVNTDPKIELGDGHEVYYRGGASADDARRVGAALEAAGYFTPGHPASATVQRPGDSIVVGLVVNDSVDDGAHEGAFHTIAGVVSRLAFDDVPVEIRLLTPELAVRRRITWE